MNSVQLPFPAGLVGFQPLHHIPAVWAETDFLRAFLFRIEYFEQFFLPAAAVAGHKSTPSGNWYFYPTTLPAKMQRRTRFLRLRKVLFHPCRNQGAYLPFILLFQNHGNGIEQSRDDKLTQGGKVSRGISGQLGQK